jgi:hypothetical protein
MALLIMLMLFPMDNIVELIDSLLSEEKVLVASSGFIVVVFWSHVPFMHCAA